MLKMACPVLDAGFSMSPKKFFAPRPAKRRHTKPTLPVPLWQADLSPPEESGQAFKRGPLHTGFRAAFVWP